ncbi:6252_t:CDS:2, partial [Cetraspora pellucida]
LCPYTKVEESFNLQASHDIMEFGISLDALKKYDHFEFPGVVPRTFVGPLLLSLVSWPTSKILVLLIPHLNKFARQYIVILSYSHWISAINSSESNRKLLQMIRYMTYTAVIFRFEVGMLLAIIVLFELWKETLSFFDTLRVGIISGLASL